MAAIGDCDYICGADGIVLADQTSDVGNYSPISIDNVGSQQSVVSDRLLVFNNFKIENSRHSNDRAARSPLRIIF